jgi:hypothetical protein
VALLALAGASLFAGAWSGLVRIGLPLHVPNPETIAGHGGIMVGGMLGTLIALERAVALDRRWAFTAPLASGVGGVAALAGLDWSFVTGAFVVASLLFVVANLLVTLRQPATFMLIMLLGAVMWAAGNLAWALGVQVERLVISWASFLVLTIAGERLELSRLRAPPAIASRVLVALTLVFSVGSLLAVFEPVLGGRLAGVSLALLTAWLVRYDLARKTLRLVGLPRYAAISVLAGYVWLALGGLLLVVGAPLLPGPLYDATLHAVFLGFVFSMVFGHAPIILPAVLRVELPYAPLLYAPLALLHASVAARIAGDLLALPALRRWGGTLNVVTLVVFALSVVFVKLRARLRAREAAAEKLASGRGAAA